MTHEAFERDTSVRRARNGSTGTHSKDAVETSEFPYVAAARADALVGTVAARPRVIAIAVAAV